MTEEKTALRGQRAFFVALSIALIWLALDQLLKSYAISGVPRYPQRLEPIPALLELSYAENRGAAWSLFSNATLPLAIFRAVAGLALLGWVWIAPAQSVQRAVSIGLVAGGALGNAVDGLTRGYVVDMLLSPTLTALYRPIFGAEYPIFNFADVGVIVGMAGVLWTTRKSGRSRAVTQTGRT